MTATRKHTEQPEPAETVEPAVETVEDEAVYVADPGSDTEKRVTQLSPEDLDKLKQKLRHAAERKVIDLHRDEYNQIAEEMFRAEGLEFTRRQTAEEKAAAKVKKVMDEQGLSREDLIRLLAATE